MIRLCYDPSILFFKYVRYLDKYPMRLHCSAVTQGCFINDADIHREIRHEGATNAPIDMGNTSPTRIFARNVGKYVNVK